MKKVLFLSVLTGFALFGCIQENTSPQPSDATGTARVKIPQLPGALVKTEPGEDYVLSITVSGPGMQPISRAWSLSLWGGKTVSFENIPAGSERVFTGILMRGKTPTHEGRYATSIGGGQTVFVPLVLRDVGTGRAEICVEIEGWPGSPDCAPIDTLPVDTFALVGCWRMQATADGVPVNGVLSFFGMEGRTYGMFTSDRGEKMYANPDFVDGAWRVILQPVYLLDKTAGRQEDASTGGMPGFAPDSGYGLYRLRIDSFSFGPADEPNGIFWGVMMDPSFRKAIGKATGTITRCDIVVEPGDTVWTDTGSVVDTTGPRDTKAYLPLEVPATR